MLSSNAVVSLALDLGFDVAGIAPAFPVPTLSAYHDWLARGFYGRMRYLALHDRVARRENPDIILQGVRSVVCVGLNYYQGAVGEHILDEPGRGRISRYAWGADYHDLIRTRLELLAERVIDRVGDKATHRCYTDTGPVLERAYAARAGLGFIGKNSCLINPRLGSWLFLGVVLLNVELAPTEGRKSGACGTCTRCLDACPTGAIVAPYVVDARRCISYLTIELKGSVPAELRPLLGNRVFGCDVCQDVCPWQRFATPTREGVFRPARDDELAPRLTDLVDMTPQAFEVRIAGRPIARTGRDGLVRNAVVALGNWGDARALDPLTRAMADPDPQVRAHAAWALKRLAHEPT